jgi:Mrp family chromosome partitioning ATPase
MQQNTGIKTWFRGPCNQDSSGVGEGQHAFMARKKIKTKTHHPAVVLFKKQGGMNIFFSPARGLATRAPRLLAPRPLAGVKHVVAIASGKGGVGKSTVASNLAAALARAQVRVGLLDADLSGPSVPTMFGTELEQPHSSPTRERELPAAAPEEAPQKELQGDLIAPLIAHGVRTMSMGNLLPPSRALAWRGPMQVLDVFFFGGGGAVGYPQPVSDNAALFALPRC